MVKTFSLWFFTKSFSFFCSFIYTFITVVRSTCFYEWEYFFNGIMIFININMLKSKLFIAFFFSEIKIFLYKNFKKEHTTTSEQKKRLISFQIIAKFSLVYFLVLRIFQYIFLHMRYVR